MYSVTIRKNKNVKKLHISGKFLSSEFSCYTVLQLTQCLSTLLALGDDGCMTSDETITSQTKEVILSLEVSYLVLE